MSDHRKPRPLHPFRFLATGQTNPHPRLMSTRPISAAEVHIVELLRSGARVLFDINAKRGLVYTFRRGVEHLMEITSRMLSALLQHGQVVMVARQGGVIHYAMTGTNASWYAPE